MHYICKNSLSRMLGASILWHKSFSVIYIYTHIHRVSQIEYTYFRYINRFYKISLNCFQSVGMLINNGHFPFLPPSIPPSIIDNTVEWTVNIVFSSKKSLPPLPRQHSAAIGVHSHCVESFAGLLSDVGEGGVVVNCKKAQLFLNTLYHLLKCDNGIRNIQYKCIFVVI